MFKRQKLIFLPRANAHRDAQESPSRKVIGVTRIYLKYLLNQAVCGMGRDYGGV
jgi:hypothetical protein